MESKRVHVISSATVSPQVVSLRTIDVLEPFFFDGLLAFAFGPFALHPSELLRYRLFKKRHVLRDQEHTERQHPKTEERQNAEHAAQHQQQRQWNPYQL